MTDTLHLFRLAMQSAVEQGNAVAEHECLFWVGHCYESMGEISRAMASFLDMRLLENRRPDLNFSDFEVWGGRKHTLECLLVNPQSLRVIEERLKEIEEYVLVHSVPPHDLYVLRGHLAMERGLWLEALNQFEFGSSTQNDSRGYSPLWYAALAAMAATRVGRLDAARDWISSIRSARTSDFAEELIDLVQSIALIDLARAERDMGELRKQLVRIGAVPLGVDIGGDKRRIAQFWGALFDESAGDPAARDHPARRFLARAPATREDLKSLFDYALAILDYRVASLRFALGVPPNDDHWHSAEPPPALRRVDRKNAERRFARARTAAQGAMRRAVHLDRALECNWRQADVTKRTRAIEAICAALGPFG